MKDQTKTKKQLIEELEALRRQSSDLKKAEEAIMQGRREWDDIFQAIGHPAIILDAQHNILSVNKATVIAAGAHFATELIGRKCYEIFHKAGQPPEGCPLVKMLSSGKPETTEMEVEACGGIYLVSCTPVFDEKGNLKKVIHIAMDITERKQAEKALRESEERFRIMFNNAADGIVLTDIHDKKFYACNKMFSDMLGYGEEEIKNLAVMDIHPKENLPYIIEQFKQLASEETNVNNDIPVKRKDGSIFYADIHAMPIRLSEKTYLMGIFHDITDRKQAEALLRKEKTFSDAMINSLPGIFYLFDEEGHLIRWNRNFEIVSGYSSEEIKKMNPLDFFSGEGKKLLEEAIREVFVEGESHAEADFISKDNIRTPYYFTGLRFISDNRPYLLGMGIDVTERKRVEEEIHSNFFAQFAINMILSESLKNIPLELILQKALNIILSIPWLSFESMGSMHLVEGESNVLVMKAQYNLPEQLKKMCAHVVFGRCLCGRAAQTKKIEFADHIDERHDICYEGMEPHGHYVVPILFGGKTLGVIAVYLKEGHIRDQDEEEFLLTVADTLAGIIVRRQTEDEKEKLQAQLLQSQKMEAIGQLAGGVAHDFNNILTAMIGYGHLLKMKLKEEDPLRSYADHILSLSDRAANLTQSLLTFSRKQIINPRPVDLNEIIKRIDHLLTRIIGEDIQLQTMLSEEDLIVMADPGQIEQVLMNIAANARDAMLGGGLLTINTETVVIDNEFIREHGFGKEGGYALITITDTGAGMDRETRERIFEPFFTTKDVGKGTGLGLAMAYGIIKQHEGHINVYSEPGRGTAFRILLPLIEAQTEEIKHEEMIPPNLTGTETVLLAEDEVAVREFTKNLLKEYGYNVLTAVDGQDAINEFKIYKNKIQIVLLDVIMPNKNGKKAYEEIMQIMPDIKVIFMSGYPGDIIYKQGIIEKGFAYIEKPVSPAKLLRKIREVLEK